MKPQPASSWSKKINMPFMEDDETVVQKRRTLGELVNAGFQNRKEFIYLLYGRPGFRWTR